MHCGAEVTGAGRSGTWATRSGKSPQQLPERVGKVVKVNGLVEVGHNQGRRRCKRLEERGGGEEDDEGKRRVRARVVRG
jgi:hypothetical protein